MPRYALSRRAWCALVCGIALLLMPCLRAQTAPSSSAHTDPKTLLLAAAAANGAPASESKPWHAKISFTRNDWSGKPELQGTIEEYWAAPDKFKVIYESTSFNQVEYNLPTGIRRTGSRDGAPPEFTWAFDQFRHPLSFDSASLDAAKLEAHELTLGTAKLVCIKVDRRKQSVGEVGPSGTYCLGESAPILRLTIAPGGFQRTIRNNVVKFQDHFIPETIERVMANPGERNATIQFSAKLDSIEPLNSVDEAQFIPPADALPPPTVITLEEKATKPQLLLHAPPIYPPIARAARVSGDVVIALQIQTDGHVSRLRVLSGPAMLEQAALDGVKKWTYKPFEQNGEPVEVNTTATVQFRIMP
jgi:TonB family protein